MGPRSSIAFFLRDCCLSPHLKLSETSLHVTWATLKVYSIATTLKSTLLVSVLFGFACLLGRMIILQNKLLRCSIPSRWTAFWAAKDWHWFGALNRESTLTQCCSVLVNLLFYLTAHLSGWGCVWVGGGEGEGRYFLYMARYGCASRMAPFFSAADLVLG